MPFCPLTVTQLCFDSRSPSVLLLYFLLVHLFMVYGYGVVFGTADDRAQLWKMNRPHRYHKATALTDVDRSLLWHLQEQSDLIVDKTRPHPYTEKDRELLWHLEECGRTLDDETKHQLYTDQERKDLWHLKDPESATEGKGEASYTDEDRSKMWHLQDRRSDQHGPNEEYTSQDRKELWHL